MIRTVFEIQICLHKLRMRTKLLRKTQLDMKMSNKQVLTKYIIANSLKLENI